MEKLFMLKCIHLSFFVVVVVLGGGQKISQLRDSQGNDRDLEIPDKCL